jgi:carbon storage regulator
MLVLSRHADEAIIVDGHIRIVVVSIRGDKVRLGIEAPPDMPVHREEVQRAIDRGEAYDGRKEARP